VYIPSSVACTSQEPPSDMWQYANLEPLVALVENAINQGRLSRDPLIPIQITPSKEVFENVRARWEYFEACCPPRNRDMWDLAFPTANSP
jgi:hypothetical protein